MSFDQIRGQDKPIEILKEYIKQSRLAGSYLFIGEEGVGKRFIAKTLAKALNCENETLDSCDGCAPCLKIEKNQHPDIHFLNNAETSDAIKIEYVRRLEKDIAFRPYEGKKKVFVIDDAHKLTAEAANALLKILEEPPPDSLILLISAKPALLFKTIISRCKILRFYPLKRPRLEEILKEDFRIDNSMAHFLAYFCEGRLGRALRLKDTDIFREKNRVIDDFVLSLRRGSDNLSVENKDNLRSYLNILAGWFRDIYFVKIGMPYDQLINLDRKDELSKLISHYTFLDLSRILNFISNACLYLEQNINTKLLFSNLRWALKGAII